MDQPAVLEHAAEDRSCWPRWAVVLLICLWLVAIILGGLADQRVAQWVRDSGTAAAVKKHWITGTVKAPGTYWVAIGLAAALWFWHPLNWRAGGLMLLTGLPGLANCLAKWVFGRARPFKTVAGMEHPAVYEPHWFWGGFWGLFKNTNLAFPSGHSCTAFATAAALAILLPKWRWAFYVVAAMVAVERVLENAHYVSDVIAGAGLGVLGVHVIVELLRGTRVGKAAETAASGCEVNHE